MSNLRSEIIRIAFEHPETRPHLLPLITAASDSAEDTYAKRSKEIDVMINNLKKDLTKHKSRFEKSLGNWGLVGDLSRVKEGLDSALRAVDSW